MVRVLMAGVLLGGCVRSSKYEDIGKACLGEPTPTWSGDTADRLILSDGDTVAVTVVLSECGSGSVDWVNQVCDVAVNGTRIEVTTSGKTKSPPAQTADCRFTTQDCGTVTVTDGDWTLVYGAGEQSFEVPYDGPSICAAN
jgi:hypothetical protein